MSITDECGGMNTTMLVSPNGYSGNNGFGLCGDWVWILLILVLGGGWGGFGGGMNTGTGMLYPWLNNSEHISGGFRDAQLSDSITSVRDGVQNLSTQLCNCCGDIQLGMSNGFNGVNNSIFGAQTAISQQMNANEIANLNRSFAEQTANAQGFSGVQSAIADTRYTIATDGCSTRNAAAMNTRDIIDSQTRGTQAILDKLYSLELDNARRENEQLRTELIFARGQASQTAQTSDIINGTYTRLSQCPVSTTPVYGNTPIFTCNQTANVGCGCGSF